MEAFGAVPIEQTGGRVKADKTRTRRNGRANVRRNGEDIETRIERKKEAESVELQADRCTVEHNHGGAL